MKFKTSELTGDNLKRVVASALGWSKSIKHGYDVYIDENETNTYFLIQWNPEKDWAQCGELIDKFFIEIKHYPDSYEYPCGAFMLSENRTSLIAEQYGETAQQAVCRCVVASVYGDEVEL